MCIYSPMPHTLSYCALIGKCALIRSNMVHTLTHIMPILGLLHWLVGVQVGRGGGWVAGGRHYFLRTGAGGGFIRISVVSAQAPLCNAK